MNDKSLTKASAGAPVAAAQPEQGAIDRVLQQVDISKAIYVPEQYAHLFKLAQGFAASDLIPKHYQGKPSNCLIAMIRADAMKLDVFFLMEHTYVVHGRLGLDGQLLIALMNKSGLFKSRIVFKYSGDSREERKCRLIATFKDSTEEIFSEVSYQMAKENGWTKPEPAYIWENGQKIISGTTPSQWDTMTDQRLAYRTAAFFCRLYCPDIIGGMTTVDELREAPAEEAEGVERAPLFARPGDAVVKPAETKKTPEQLAGKCDPIPENEPKTKDVSPVEKVEPKPAPTPADDFPTTDSPNINKLIQMLKDEGFDRRDFNNYMIAIRRIGEGMDIVSLDENFAIKMVTEIVSTRTGFKNWKRKQSQPVVSTAAGN